MDPDETHLPHTQTGEDTSELDVTPEEVAALTEEQEMRGEDFKEFTNTLLEQNGPRAVHALVKLAHSASSERVRLDASKYIVERVLGPLSKHDVRDTAKDPLAKLLNAVGIEIG